MTKKSLGNVDVGDQITDLLKYLYLDTFIGEYLKYLYLDSRSFFRKVS